MTRQMSLFLSYITPQNLAQLGSKIIAVKATDNPKGRSKCRRHLEVEDISTSSLIRTEVVAL